MRIVIVGAGAAGCVLGARLSESGLDDVVLVESGPDYVPEQLPLDLADARHNSLKRHDWGFRHRVNSKQPFPFLMPRGRVVGGSSAVNTCIALRGQPEDYAEWADRGLRGWGWDDVLPSFRRLERDLDFGDRPWHGADGPLPLLRPAPETWTPWAQGFVAAALEAGYENCPDTNEPGRFGVGPHAFNRIDGRRISAAEAWLTPSVRARANFTLLANTHAVRVRFEGRRAVGLEVLADKESRILPADRVILSSGALLTPLLLVRSGVGQREMLDQHGVEHVAINPNIAARLLDHPGCAMFFWPRSGVIKTSDPLLQTALRVSSGSSKVPGDLLIQPGSKVPFPTYTLPFCSIMCSIGKPKSHGRLHLRDIRPGREKLHIESALLDHPDDRAVAVGAMERIADLASRGPLRELASHLYPLRRTASDSARLDRWVRRSTDSGYHPSGTVPMGTHDDPAAATDGDGRVRGVEGLFVADASLFPTIPTANVHLPTLMVAEHLAERWRKSPTNGD